MNIETILKSGTEHAHQVALFNWAAIAQNKGFAAACDWLYADKLIKKTDPHLYRPTDDKAKLLQWMHAIPNGGSRGDDAKTRAIRGGALKAEGVKSGVADVFLPVLQAKPYGTSGLYIEMKKPDGRLSKEQSEFAQFVQEQGFKWVCCFGVFQAVEQIEIYLTNVA